MIILFVLVPLMVTAFDMTSDGGRSGRTTPAACGRQPTQSLRALGVGGAGGGRGVPGDIDNIPPRGGRLAASGGAVI